MAHVIAPSDARRFTGGAAEFDIEADTVRRLVAELDRRYPGLGPWLEGRVQHRGLRLSGFGGDVEVDASISSQFLSGLLMAAPFARADSRDLVANNLNKFRAFRHPAF